MPVFNFCIAQGTDSWISFLLTDSTGPLDLTGFSAAMQLRTSIDSQTAVDTLTTGNGRLTINADEHQIKCFFPHEQTSTYPASTLVYDLEIQSAEGFIFRVLSGRIKVKAEVTRVDDNDF